MSCERPDLPILPLRRALVPDTRPECITTVAGSLHISAKMGLRALRMGYLYVLLDQQVWHIYEVSAATLLVMYWPDRNLPDAYIEVCSRGMNE